MADEVRLELDTATFARTLFRAADVAHAGLARALEKTSFDVVEGLKREGLRAFAKASNRGKQFVGGRGAFKFDLDRERLVSIITPGPNPPKRGVLLAEHERGATIVETPLRLGLKKADLLAIPINSAANARRRSGRVPGRLEPGVLLSDPKRRAFLAMRGDRGVLVVRKGRKGSTFTEALYVITPEAKLPKIFRWEPTVREIAERVLPIKVREVFAKLPRA